MMTSTGDCSFMNHGFPDEGRFTTLKGPFLQGSEHPDDHIGWQFIKMRFIKMRFIRMPTRRLRFLDPIHKPLEPVGVGFGCQRLGLQQFLKPAGIGVCGHAPGYSWKRCGDPGDVQALPQLVGAPECALPCCSYWLA
jgi:hypothetical protein